MKIKEKIEDGKKWLKSHRDQIVNGFCFVGGITIGTLGLYEYNKICNKLFEKNITINPYRSSDEKVGISFECLKRVPFSTLFDKMVEFDNIDAARGFVDDLNTCIKLSYEEMIKLYEK